MPRNKERELIKLQHNLEMKKLREQHVMNLQIELAKTLQSDPMMKWYLTALGGTGLAVLLKVFEAATNDESITPPDWQSYLIGGSIGLTADWVIEFLEQVNNQGFGYGLMKLATNGVTGLSYAVCLADAMSGQGGEGNPLLGLLEVV